MTTTEKLHLIQGLLQTLPEPESDWPSTARVKWLQTAANIFDLIYKGDGGITVSAAMRARGFPMGPKRVAPIR